MLVPCLAACLAGAVLVAQDEATRPNVLFISVDDLNDWVGCLGGHPQTRTPNIDKLAASGVLFTNAYCPGAACNPSRSAVFTGLPPHRSGLWVNGQKMREVMPDAELIPKYFSRHGYWSGGAGKMLHYFVDQPSWDDYLTPQGKENPFPHYHYPKERPATLPYEKWMYVEADWKGFDMTDEEFQSDYLVADWVIDQLEREREPAQPFFLACGIYRPHLPWFVPQRYVDQFPLDEVQLPPGVKAGDLDDVPAAGQRVAGGRYHAHILEHGLWKDGVRHYLAAIAYADAMVGRVLDALEQSRHRDDTIVVLWSDHGWHLGEKGHWRKFTGWRQAARVPLIIRAPKGTPGLPDGTHEARCARPVNLVDLFATLNALCGLPEKPDIGGHSLVPLLRDPDAGWPHASVTTFRHRDSLALSTQRYRYIRHVDGSEELYDIETDRYEWDNLAVDPEHAATLSRLREQAPVPTEHANAVFEAWERERKKRR